MEAPKNFLSYFLSLLNTMLMPIVIVVFSLLILLSPLSSNEITLSFFNLILSYVGT